MNSNPGDVHARVYRADIDGLRAVAVLSVLVFHAFPAALPGGFVGVDVFFVISGYLITSILVNQIDSGRYSILDFYARRVRRIFPALGLVLAASLTFGWISLLPDEFAALGRHVAGGAAFVSNFVLRGEAGYFDTSGEMKPLLHLWSLGVEEQFYLVWPLMLYAVSRFRMPRYLMLLIGLVTSFSISVWLTHRSPVYAFYHPLPRFWELLVGGALACAPRFSSTLQKNGKLADGAAALGIAGVIGAIALLNSDSLFPGWRALFPVVGSALIIGAGPAAWLNRKLLAHPIAVSLGLISYPLYLWHWPLLSFANILFAGAPPVPVRIGLLVVALLLAYLTYRLVELPLRTKPRILAKPAVLCAVVWCCGVVGFMVLSNGGVASRAVVAINAENTVNADLATAGLGKGNDLVEPGCGVPAADAGLFLWCYHDKRQKPTAAVWGDSHANALYWGLVRESEPSMRWLHIGRPSCPPMIGANIDPDCDRANRVALSALTQDETIKLVLITGAKWAISDKRYPNKESGRRATDSGEAGLAATIAALEAAHKRVVFTIDNPEFADPKRCMTSRETSSAAFNHLLAYRKPATCSMTLEELYKETKSYRAMVARLKESFPNVLVYDPTSVLCDVAADECSMWRGRDFLYSYGDHISDVANGLIASRLLPMIRSWTHVAN
ncbi:acyltransferase family protein [Pandoraea bronchicola]|uniref:O-acetyltransferase OatA n=1 Tax=Pandoraea bronchicola TaxID=2508287 RepID=A0A5E5BVL8_9BURK|nr:acyltransferase family protein [Pandoraea bronchicola]VVE90391.1 O-acetyltransferase OatA [Pandoraea bronchicola]